MYKYIFVIDTSISRKNCDTYFRIEEIVLSLFYLEHILSADYVGWQWKINFVVGAKSDYGLPKVGMTFRSKEEAWLFWVAYGIV
jgi:hypothetical protein